MAKFTAGRRRFGGAVVALIVLSGCSGGTAAKVGAGSDPQVPAEAAQALRRCMSDAGFQQFEAGTVGAPGQDPIWDDEQFSAAYKRCEVESGIQNYAPKDRHDDVDVKEVNQQNVALVSCIRSRGWKVPDPQPGEKGILVPRFPQLATAEEQAAFNKDMQACGKAAGVGVDDAGGAHNPDSQGGRGSHTQNPSAPR